jgi:hypothetical protein
MRKTKHNRIKRRRTKRRRQAKGINLDNKDNNGYTLRGALKFYSKIITEYKFYHNKDIEKLINNVNKIIKPSNTTFKAPPALLHNMKMAKKQLKRLSHQIPPITETSALKHLLELLDKQTLLGSRPKMMRGTPAYGSRITPWDPKAIRMDTFL